VTLDTSRRVAFATAAVAFVFLAATSPAIPIVWDEGEYLDRANYLITWFHLIWHGGSDGGLHAFSAPVLHDHWHFFTCRRSSGLGGRSDRGHEGTARKRSAGIDCRAARHDRDLQHRLRRHHVSRADDVRERGSVVGVLAL
jgi:hypothetical protein